MQKHYVGYVSSRTQANTDIHCNFVYIKKDGNRCLHVYLHEFSKHIELHSLNETYAFFIKNWKLSVY